MTDSKVILVTGSATGLGLNIAKLLSSKNHKVYASMRDIEGKNKTNAQSIRDWGNQYPTKITVIELDVSCEKSVDRAISAIVEEEGRLDVVINNAGLGALGITESFTVEQAKQVFEVNTFGPMRVNQAALPHMRSQNSGLLLHITSSAGRLCFPFLGIYNASKFAIEALAESYIYELKSFEIDIAIIEPGAYPSELHDKRLQPKNSHVIKDYGETAQIPALMVQGMKDLMSSPQAPDANEIANAVYAIVAMDTGSRPLRTVVGNIATEGIEALNEATQKYQSQLLDSLGMN